MASRANNKVLVVGATGDLGGRVVDALLARGKTVRALVREGTDPSKLEAKHVEIVRGDLMDRASLDRAVKGMDAVVTSAAGYMRRRKGDSLKTDDVGNKNLVDAAKAGKVGVFVFTSILNCDLAPDVPHFWQKKLIEDHLDASGIDYVSLRPGAFLGGAGGSWLARGLKKGKLAQLGSGTARWSYIHPDEVARALAMAVDSPRAIGRKIDLGSDRPASLEELAGIFGNIMGRPVTMDRASGRIMKMVFGVGSIFSSSMSDLSAMFRFFETGKYVADTRPQQDLFDRVPTLEEAATKLVTEQGLPRAR